MVITDSPTSFEEKLRKFGTGASFAPIKAAIDINKLKDKDFYFTGVCKIPTTPDNKSDVAKDFKQYLQKEIDLLKPPVIILMGQEAIKMFFKDEKPEPGSVIYNPDIDTSFIIGVNPGRVYFNPEMQNVVNDIFERAKEIIGE
jgi:DNA polymerase-3 subunit alpha